MAGRDGVLAPLDGKSGTLFLVAGGLLVVFAASTGVRTVTDLALSEVHGFFGPAGFFFGAVGLLGLYPRLVARTPWGARLAALVAVVPAVGWFLTAGIGLGTAVGILPDASVVLPGAAFVVTFLTTILAYVLFGVASLRVDVHSGTVSVLLLAPAAVFVALIAGMAIIPSIEWAEFVLDSGHAIAHLAVGLALRRERGPIDHSTPTADATPGQ